MVSEEKDTRDILRRTFVTTRIIMQVKLMILLRIPPLSRSDNLRRNGLLVPFLGHFVGYFMRDLGLFLVVRKDCAAVLGSDVGTLAVFCRGIVHAVEEFEQLAVGDNGGVEGYL